MIINESLAISQNPETIWNFWLDVTNDVQWRNGIIKAEWTSQPPYGVGSTGAHMHKKMGVMNWEVTRYEERSSFEFIHTAGGLKGSIAIFQVTPENNGSRIQVQMRISGPFFMRCMIFFMGSMMRKALQADLLKLKELLETQSTDKSFSTNTNGLM